MENDKNKIVSLRDVQGTERNPFIFELKGRMYLQPRANTVIARGQDMIDTKTGEVLQDDVFIGQRKIIDRSEFAKLYASEIGTLFNLSKSAINVFMHLTKIMDFDNKAIFDYMKEYNKLGYRSHKQCLMGLRELITKEIIHPHIVSCIWWLNPTIVCKGERFAKYTEYVTTERNQRDIEKGEAFRINEGTTKSIV